MRVVKSSSKSFSVSSQRISCLLFFLLLANQSACAQSTERDDDTVQMNWRGAHLTLPRSAVRTQGGDFTRLGKQFFITNVNSGNYVIEESRFTLDSIHIEILPITDKPRSVGVYNRDGEGDFKTTESTIVEIDRIHDVAFVDGISLPEQESAAIISFDFLDTKNVSEDGNYTKFKAHRISGKSQDGLYFCDGEGSNIDRCQVIYTYGWFYISAHWNTYSYTAPYAVNKTLPEVANIIDNNVRRWTR